MNRHIIRRSRSFVLPAIISLVLSGCATAPEIAGGTGGMGSQVRIATRDFLLHSAEPFDGYGAFGYMLFTTRPESEQSERRYLAACNAFMKTLEPSSSYDIPSRLMPTYWLLFAWPQHQTCDELVRNYDYARAKPLISLAGKLSSLGPVLAAWDHLPESNVSHPHQLILDLSNFSDEDMRRAFQIWTEQLARDPSLWQNGFDVVRIREGFRSLLQKYGEQILQVITKST